MVWSFRSHASPLPWGFLVLLTVLLLVAALWDLRRRRIPNVVNAVVVSSGLAAEAVARGWTAALGGAAAGVAVIALYWVPWRRGRIGGGDVKLTAAAAVWIGAPLLPEYLLATAVAAGILAAACYALSTAEARLGVRSNLRLAAATLSVPEVSIRGGDGRRSVPYGVAAGTAALVVGWIGVPWF
jgi:prepilin peptidase CpaA